LTRYRIARFATLPAVALVVAVGFAAGLGFTGAHANGNDTVQACVNKFSGAVRMNYGNTPLTCTANEFKRSWDGQDQSSIAEIYIATSSETYTSDASFGLVANCPPGYDVIGGGVDMNNAAYYLVTSHPDYTNDRWVASATTPNAATQLVRRPA
jgi:hypothetical protein